MMRHRHPASVRLLATLALFLGISAGPVTPGLAQQEINGCRIAPRTVCPALDLRGVILRDVDLSGADLTGAKVTEKQLDTAL